MRAFDWPCRLPRATPVFIFLLNLVLVSNATLVCDGCRPVELQEGPGVGLSLSPGYGTVSVEFVNGTVADVGIIEGSEAYVRAVKIWPEARFVQSIPPEPNIPQRILIYLGLRKPRLPVLDFPQSLNPLVDMAQALWQRANATIHLHHTKVRLSIPDFTDTDLPLRIHETSILTAAGMESLRWSPASQNSLLSLYNLESCYDDEDVSLCAVYHGRYIKSVLSIHLDRYSMSLRSMIRDDGTFYPDGGMSKLVWIEDGTDLAGEISQFIATEDFDLVALSGPRAQLAEGIIQDLFAGNTKISPEDFVRTPDEYAFASARGAARVARRGMCNDWEVCIPNSWCSISKYCTGDFYRIEGEIENKGEL